MKRRNVTILVILLLLAASAIALLLDRLVAEGTAIPFQSMQVTFEDEDGMATVRSDAFEVRFAGHSFGPGSRGGNYLVDGRYGARLLGGADADQGTLGGGVSSAYSQRRRQLTFRFQGHEIAYSHAEGKLSVAGREYSTAQGRVRLLVKADGAVEPLAAR